ncbi:MAG: lysoplasmalogenase [Owenweeksia sp.]
MKVRDFSKLYFVFLLLHLATIYQPESELLATLSKPLLMVSLLVFFISKTGQVKTFSQWWVALALLFSLVGDTLLMWNGEIFFLGGMGAFALAHLAYISYFLKERKGVLSIPGFIGSIIVVGFSIFALNHWIMLPETLRLPVNAYGIILGLNLIAAVQYHISGNRKAPLIPSGVLLFILSDILLAYQKFNLNQPDKFLEMGVMTLYGSAQFLIIAGVLNRIEE